MNKLFTTLIIVLGLIQVNYGQGFYNIDSINTIEITFTQSNWDYLLDQLVSNGLEERLTGTVSINGQVYDSVGIRYKGNSSYSANQVKNPLNVKLDYIINDQEIEGFGTLKLANCYKDPSFVREVLSYEIARKYMPASQSNFANVYINGTYLGLYTSDQSVDKFFARTHFGSDENARFKGELLNSLPPPQMGGVWEYNGTDSSSYFEKYDMKSDEGWQDLISFLDTLNNFNSSVDHVLNIDRHLWLLAFSNLLVNLDGPINNPQNYYIYKDDNGRFNPSPWDLNESFGVFTYLQGSGSQSTTQLQQLDPFHNLNSSTFPVISKVLNNASYRKMYVAHMKTIIEENFSNSQYETRALDIQNIISADVQADPNKFYTYANFITNVNNSVGGGPGGGIIGLTQLMQSRITYLQSQTDFLYTAPSISNVAHSPIDPSPGTEIWFTAEVSDEDDVWLCHRSKNHGIFEKVLMYDDGNHQDGQAGDGIYGVSVMAGSTSIHYYIYSQNQGAAAFSPVRAEYEFYEISIISDLVINEFLADNESAVADQDGEFDDWIELYNNGNQDIQLLGYYLSDDGAEPDKWSFPDTTIMAGEYLVVWADDDVNQQGLHASFKLSKSGETIVLSDNNLVLVDEVSYLQQKEDTSTGRYVNGTGNFIQMVPTFGAMNTDVLSDIEEYSIDEYSFELEQNHPNPFRTSTNIGFRMEQGGEVELCIYNTLGENIKTLVSAYLPPGEYSYPWGAGNIHSGLYFYALSVDGKRVVKKMLVQ